MALPNQTFKAELEAVQQTVGLPALEDADEVTKHVKALQHPKVLYIPHCLVHA